MPSGIEIFSYGHKKAIRLGPGSLLAALGFVQQAGVNQDCRANAPRVENKTGAQDIEPQNHRVGRDPMGHPTTFNAGITARAQMDLVARAQQGGWGKSFSLFPAHGETRPRAHPDFLLCLVSRHRPMLQSSMSKHIFVVLLLLSLQKPALYY